MKRLLLLMIPFLLCGCSHDMNRQEIDEVDMIHVLGIDWSGENYTLSALYSIGGGADAESAKVDIIQASGNTVYQAYENLKLKNKKNITLAQTSYYLIGEEAAKNGIDYCLDFLSRDETIKLESFVYITKETDASTVLQDGVENELLINEDLEALSQKQLETLTRNDNTILGLLNEMEQSYSSILIPSLLYDEDSFLIEGYAVFDHLQLYDYLDGTTAMGVNFVKNIVRRCPIYISDTVGLLVSNTKTKLKTNVKKGIITVTIKIDFESFIKEVNTEEDIFTKDKLDELTNSQNNYIKDMIDKAINFSISSNLDIFGIARMIEIQNAKEWATAEPKWSENIQDLNYVFDINSKISKSFMIGNAR